MATNFYSAAKNNPEVLEKRKQRIAQLDSEIRRLQTLNAKRTPDWDEERIMALDRAALELGKRCIMWDDKGSGFFLMLNWDWVKNCPAAPSTPDLSFDPGWWINAKEILQPPLLDTSLPDTKLAAWLDANTMNVHSKLFERQQKIKRQQENDGPFKFVIEGDEYWARLHAFPR